MKLRTSSLKLFVAKVFLYLLLVPLISFSETAQNQQIIQKIISESIANYSGNCPCPYNRASNGSSCGRRSAYSKPGGYALVCYAQDVTLEMISTYKHKHGIRQ
ncbi:hypothetical protein MCEREM36_00935 [Candidatus Methylopumilus universalis]|uniref:hypothetical protein n=1 Tax=Candidatus Methylopumilus universalis TaxID=2588536 RepID=UPI003BEECD27